MRRRKIFGKPLTSDTDLGALNPESRALLPHVYGQVTESNAAQKSQMPESADWFQLANTP
jgi:hypothetical protein